MDDLPAAKEDIEVFKRVMNTYNVDQEFFCADASYKEIQKLTLDLTKTFVKNKNTNFAVIYLVAGHGMNIDGKQIVLLNEFNEKTNWYRKWNLEDNLRTFAEYKNTY